MQPILEWMAWALGGHIFWAIGALAAYLFFKEKGALIAAAVVSALVLIGKSMGMLTESGISAPDDTLVTMLFITSVISVVPYLIALYSMDLFDRCYSYLFDNNSVFLRKLFFIPSMFTIELLTLTIFGILIGSYDIYTKSFFWEVRGIFFWALFLFIILKVFDIWKKLEVSQPTMGRVSSGPETKSVNASTKESDAAKSKARGLSKNFYDILGVSSGAEPEVIRAAYKALILKYNESDSENLEARSVEIDLAFSVLSDPEKRRNYDETLK